MSKTELKSISRAKPKLLDIIRTELRARHYSFRTEKVYINWIKNYIIFHNKRHPKGMGAEEIKAFINNLAVTHNVSSSAREI